MLKEQLAATLAIIPSTIGGLHLLQYLHTSDPVQGWAAMTGMALSLPGWIWLAGMD